MKAGGRRKTLLFLAIVVTLVVVLVLSLAVIQAPKPKVELIFQGFSPQTTLIPGLEQVMVQVGLTNEGKMFVRLEDTDRIAITSEKLSGDHPEEQTTESLFTSQKVPPHSNALLRVETLPAAPKWRVTVSYTYYRAYPVKIILRERLLNSGLLAAGPTGKFKKAIFRTVWWITDLLPDPAPQQGEVSTPFITNQPPVDPLLPAQER